MKISPFYLIDPHNWLLTTNADVAAAQQKALANPHINELELEEYVRQWALRELLETYNYPKEWLGERLIIEEIVQMATMKKQADISIKNDRGRTFLYVETKARGVSDAEFADAERQLEGYLSSTHTATVGMVTDGTPRRTKVVQKKIDPNDYDYIPDIPEYQGKDVDLAANKLVREHPDPTNPERRTGLRPIDEKYESILFECHSAIRDIDGLHDDEALDEMCKMIYTKIYDERTTKAGEDFRFQTYIYGNIEEVAASIRDRYDEARTYDIQTYAQRIPNYERSRGVFKAQLRLSSLAVTRVVELLQSYSFIDSKEDIKGKTFQKVLAPAVRAGMGQYFTPDVIVRMMVAIIDPNERDLILDPFCGSGHFLTSSLDYVRHKYLAVHSPSDMRSYWDFAYFHLHGIEKSDRMVRIAVTDMLLHDDGHTNIRNTDALLSFENYPDIKALGEADTPEVFDIILTNPPFGSIADTTQMIGRFSLGQGKKKLPLEILGLERCLQFLKPGGKLGIVLPDAIVANRSTKWVRDWYHQQAKIVAIISLPGYTFVPFGANVKPCVLFLRKWRKDEDRTQDYNIYLAEMHEIGYDAALRNTGDDEANAISTDFHTELGW
jgi:type I restriction enzyme M protein